MGGSIAILRMCGETFPCLTVEAGWTFLRWQGSWTVAVVVSLSSLVSLLTDSSLHGVKKLAPPTSCCCVINSLVGIILLQGIAHSSFLNRWGWTNLSCDYCSYTAWFWRHDLAKASDAFHSGGTSTKGTSVFSQYMPPSSSFSVVDIWGASSSMAFFEHKSPCWQASWGSATSVW